MTRNRPGSLQGARKTALKARSRALAVLALTASGCTFDTMPSTVARDDAGSIAKWQPPSLARRDRIISAQKADAQVDAGSSTRIITSGDAGMRRADADGGGRVVDAGRRPPQEQPKPDAAPSTANTAGSAAMGTEPAMTPDMPSQCMPGMYEGTFEGPVTFAVGSINSVSGIIRAELVRDASSDDLQIRNGVMTGKDNVGVGMTAAWTGRLNCATKQLEDGRHESGAWDNGSTFTGTLEGMYAAEPSTLSGTWKVQSEQIPLAGGNGTWSMSLREPPP